MRDPKLDPQPGDEFFDDLFKRKVIGVNNTGDDRATVTYKLVKVGESYDGSKPHTCAYSGFLRIMSHPRVRVAGAGQETYK
jgi:hypothetical protein